MARIKVEAVEEPWFRMTMLLPFPGKFLSIVDDWMRQDDLEANHYFMAKSDIISARLEISFRGILHYTMAK